MNIKDLKILYLTQKVDKDDNILFPFYKWLNLLGAKVNKINVICLQEGRHDDLADNIKVHSLGKEKGEGQKGYLRNFYLIAWRLFKNKEVDLVFCHMTEINVLLVWPMAWLFNKPIFWWKAHGHLSWKSKLALLAVKKVFTSSASGFPVKTKKRLILSQGVDTDYFKFKENFSEKAGKVMWAGRISAIKNMETLIEAADILINRQNSALTFSVYGNPIMTADFAYLEKLKKLTAEKNLTGKIIFEGELAHGRIAQAYRGFDIFVNTSNTGSLDKTVLEAMASGVIVINSNYGYKEILQEFPMCQFEQGNTSELADKIQQAAGLSAEARRDLASRLRNIVVRDHNMDKLIDKFLRVFEKFTR